MSGESAGQPASASGPEGPIRTCVGCRVRASRAALLRVVAVEVGGSWAVVPDPRHRHAGRGASLHPCPECLDLAERRRAFSRALRRGDPLDLTELRAFVAARRAPR